MSPREAPVPLLVSAGGVLGATARYGVERAWPHGPADLPWATFVTNTTGCLAMGMLMVLAVEAAVVGAWARPLLGVGVLGGFTTFSTYAVGVEVLTDAQRPDLAVTYLLMTPVAAVAAAATGTVLARGALRIRADRTRNETDPEEGP